MDLTDIIYSNDYINILIQNYVAQSERYQMLFPESSALLTLNPQYSVLFLERSLLPENLFGAVPFTGFQNFLRRSPRSHWKSPGLSRRRISTVADIQAKM
ncbi:hypothetical protein [Blautia sp. OF11-22]|uniref:hypothetical protein n=1 Tax=Blautia sp. OF11-22 TaxID=2292982 RepID=UPI000E5CCE20|nr:hypothetical protein [Blautia sp. OF11-22]RHV77380.1 hypothetical protein DXB02_13230 [Blautia sp. OF11-22]